MIDLKLLDIFATVCVGFFTIILIVLFYFLFNKFFVKNKFNEKKFTSWLCDNILNKDIKNSGYLIVGSIFIYFFGLLAGDLTDRMTDSNNRKEKNPVLRELHWFSKIKEVGQLRKQSLIDSDTALTTLGTSVFSSHEMIKKANRAVGEMFYLQKDSSLVSIDSMQALTKAYVSADSAGIIKFDKFISLLFYNSKNWCYSKEHEPLNELKAIQNRIDLSRSIVLLVSVAIQLLGIFLIVFFIIYFIKYLHLKKHTDRLHVKSVITASVRSLLIFIVLLVLSKECYRICQLSFNKRAFGYYVSYLDQKADMLKLAGDLNAEKAIP